MTHDMGQVFDVAELSRTLRETLSVRTVFGEAYEKGGKTVIPVVSVCSAHGIGGGLGDSDLGPAISAVRAATSTEDVADAEQGSAPASGAGGGGGALSYLRPVGAYVIEADGHVRWQPAIDPVMLAGIGAVVASLALLTVPRTMRALARICGHGHKHMFGHKHGHCWGKKALG